MAITVSFSYLASQNLIRRLVNSDSIRLYDPEPAGYRLSCQHVFPLELWIFVQDLLDLRAGRKEIKDQGHPDSRATDAGLPEADVRIYGNSAQKFAHLDQPVFQGYQPYATAIARICVRGIHMSAELGVDDRTARLAVGRGNADIAPNRTERNRDGKAGLLPVRYSEICALIDRIAPFCFRMEPPSTGAYLLLFKKQKPGPALPNLPLQR